MNSIDETRERIARLGRLLFDRNLTDAAGGNISVRVGDRICMTPSLTGSNLQWQLTPEHILLIDLDGKILEGGGALTRETNVHLALHREFGDYGTSVIHAHPRNVLVFAALERSIPAMFEATLKFGEIKCIQYAPAHSKQLADNIVAAIRGQEARIAKHAAGVIAPWHGIFLIGKDINAAFDAVERIDTSAYCILMAEAAGHGAALVDKTGKLVQSVQSFQKP